MVLQIRRNKNDVKAEETTETVIDVLKHLFHIGSTNLLNNA